ncbi:hypothetical protein [Mycobacterium hubeiense]|uniref:hypothetical protein n=1 Tax=Mycobacterium hubeiense TaxID=1867256 RepID=UPI000C7F047F|nr:hypothetical protein [Mycobacterium sp. QGD 101]
MLADPSTHAAMPEPVRKIGISGKPPTLPAGGAGHRSAGGVVPGGGFVLARTRPEPVAAPPRSSTVTSPDSPGSVINSTLADVRTQGNLLIQDRTVTGDTAPGLRCQHTLGV